MNKARVAFGVAFLLVAMISLSAVAQTDAPPAQNQGSGMSGEHHGHMDHMGPKGGHMMDDPQAHLDHLSQMVNLTEDQKAKILPIFQDTSKLAQEIRQDASLAEQDRRTKMRSLHEKSMAQVRAVLTPEQQAKIDQMMKQHEGMGRGKGMGPKSGGQQQAPPQ
jgi:Spy/CpxP family protein refolding chaperone